ncbi:MAG: N-acetylmuramoyl-L-alanine amidase [candidate division KSB1 bacterium]|nr:N-acetylmuramoyl-L-alanine amidase [candidate division KSB1 bacterium]MDZ7274519.1 N-acetylmuramoyl-L-alanine amidase [candidate division KSB1 bacterium]MDZ7284820.1 N-acetylmuramoyl-L-alanine amidase [candidate division KSB1 bacterium]MDZ7297760.1 N-acetylmuramoyl-L-alanine amidase [candidate division KSB1 bacterium]MDZ7308691.1 N-acetylmuramoyl-L-alanine amidase [candidate division KSB1 bacterium]
MLLLLNVLLLSRVWSQTGALPFTLIKLPESGDVEFVALGELADYLQVRTFYSEKARKVILYVGATEIKVTAFNPFVQVGGRTVQLPVETGYAENDILVPLHYFASVIRPLYPRPWPALLGGGATEETFRANLTEIAVEEKANGTLIRITATQPFARKHLSTRISNGWLYVDIVGGRVAPGAVRPLTGSGVIRSIAPVQAGEVAQLSFQLSQEIDPQRITIGGQGNQILVSLPTQEVVPSTVLRNLETVRQKWRIDTIVLDPGHGGRDPGAMASDGTREKDITLQVAKRLKHLIEEKLGLQVVMTRESDVYVSLTQRTSLANAAAGKLFISLHCNANRSRRVNGTTTYFLGPAKTDEALEVALLENSVVKYDTDAPADAQSEEDFILTAMAQNAFNHESEDLAAIIQEEMSLAVGLPDRGVQQAGFRVLVGASMPNVLVEMAFISNPREARLLRDAAMQERMAHAIMNSIKRFKEKYETGS